MKRRYHFHAPGLIYFLLVLLIGLAAARHGSNILVWVFGVLLGAVLVSGVISGAMLVGLRLARMDPRHGAVGEPLVIRYAVRNRSRFWPIFNIHVQELPVDADAGWPRLMAAASAWVMHVPMRDTVHGEAVFHPTARGPATFDRVRVWTTFPFGLIKKSVTFEHGLHTLIYPRLLPLRDDILNRIIPSGPSGTRMSRRSGNGDEYFGMREYKPGDSLRRVAWKRKAGLDDLVSIERTRPSPPRLRIVLNLVRPTAELRYGPDGTPDGRAFEERAISLAASLVRRAERAEFEVGLTILGTPIGNLPVRRGHWHIEKIMAALAGIGLDAARIPATTIPDHDHAAIVVIHPDRVDPDVVPGDAVHLTARQLDHLVVAGIEAGAARDATGAAA